jgi:hypothetical protein
MVPEEIIFIMIITHKNKRIMYIYFNNLDNLLGTPSFHTERGCVPQKAMLDAAPADHVQMDRPDKECNTVTGHSYLKRDKRNNQQV